MYGPSVVPASKPEWYATKFASGCLRAAGQRPPASPALTPTTGSEEPVQAPGSAAVSKPAKNSFMMSKGCPGTGRPFVARAQDSLLASSCSARFKSTAFVATIMELSDMRRADHSGRSSIP